MAPRLEYVPKTAFATTKLTSPYLPVLPRDDPPRFLLGQMPSHGSARPEKKTRLLRGPFTSEKTIALAAVPVVLVCDRRGALRPTARGTSPPCRPSGTE